ncbi:MAG: carbonic anhydrase family protein [Bdellovibrionales bacterium]|nr:carbonic anhydrase family protein [Bdellovibrionales bacterium]
MSSRSYRSGSSGTAVGPGLLLILLLASAFAVLAPWRSLGSESQRSWGYAGPGGPEQWADLDPKFAACRSGKRQSPVDLRWTAPASGKGPVFRYKPSRFRVIDTGHAVQVNFDAGNTFLLDEKIYRLEQLHFHTASEHALSGARLPLEVHLVHRSEIDGIAVVAVLFREGSAMGPLNRVLSGIPEEKGEEADWGAILDPSVFLPEKRTYYRYEGSLTTPPCTEGVAWSVFNTPLELSAEQLARLRRAYAGNARPLQALHGRRPANY